MSEGTEDEGWVVPEVVVHGADPGAVRVLRQTGWSLLHGGVDTEVEGRLPLLALQLGKVLPHIARENTIVPIIIQQLELILSIL